jgi:ubiquinone/menaquinone biosynthesis C-methylase UbiE
MEDDKPRYDDIAQDYHEFVEREFSSHSTLGLAVQSLLQRLGDVQDKILCDVGCGEGKLANYIALQGASATGVDISSELLKIARTNYPTVTFIEDDAQSLQKLTDSAFDIVISNFALMDIPDLPTTYQAVRRILRTNGRFIFTITHPCFQSPHADSITH